MYLAMYLKLKIPLHPFDVSKNESFAAKLSEQPCLSSSSEKIQVELSLKS